MGNQYVFMKVEQGSETPVQKLQGKFRCRFAYARSADTKMVGDKGQDYLAFGKGTDSFIFALCDGVSLSFCGDLAARFLGDALLDWLASPIIDRTNEQQKIYKSLLNHLQNLTGPASTFVGKYHLPAEVTGILREVLEEKRKLGSETTFICGRIDLPSRVHKRGRVIFAWQGDSRLRVWGDQQEKTSQLGNTFHTSQRWSTRRGPVGGVPNVLSTDLYSPTGISRLLVYSDGLAELDDYQRIPGDHELQMMIEAAGRRPTSDDIAVLDLSWDIRAKHHEVSIKREPLIKNQLYRFFRRFI